MVSSKVIAVILIVVLAVAGFGVYKAYFEKNSLLLATTTSTYDSGLLDSIIPDFEAKYDCEVKVTAVGTGQALTLGMNGDADVLLVHAPEREQQFVDDGYGLYRKKVMYNQFVVVGPSSDPAGVNGMTNVTQAFQLIYNDNLFCSRGDDSGTHSKEKSIWEAAGFDIDGIENQANSSWYLSLGQGMGDTLRTASEKEAHTLTDEGTFYSMGDQIYLVVHVSGDPLLFNQYGVIPVNGAQYSGVNQVLAESFCDWIISGEVQDMIDSYTKNNKQLFIGNAED